MAKMHKKKVPHTGPASTIPRAPEHPEYVQHVLDAARRFIERGLPHDYREDFVGQAEAYRRREHLDMMIQITLTHTCGASLTNRVNVAEHDITNTDVLDKAGTSLGRALASQMAAHHVGCGAPVAWRQEYASQFPNTQPVLKRPGTVHVVFAPKPNDKRSLIPKKVCPTCGETDDKFPDWGECGHDY